MKAAVVGYFYWTKTRTMTGNPEVKIFGHFSLFCKLWIAFNDIFYNFKFSQNPVCKGCSVCFIELLQEF